MPVIRLSCAKPFPLCSLIESRTKPCLGGIIIIPLTKMRKQKLTEAELLGRSHRDGKWQFLNLYQDSDTTKGGLGGFLSSYHLQ